MAGKCKLNWKSVFRILFIEHVNDAIKWIKSFAHEFPLHCIFFFYIWMQKLSMYETIAMSNQISKLSSLEQWKNANSQLLKNFFFQRRSFLCERRYLLNKIVHDKQFNVIMQGQNKRVLSHIKEKDFWHFWIIWTQKGNKR